jgi:hypothetical protein
MTASDTVPLLRIARYRSISEFDPNEANDFAVENDLAIDEIPSKPPNKSAFSAGNTEAVDLYHFGKRRAIIVVQTVQIKIKREINFLYFVIIEKKSIKLFVCV